MISATLSLFCILILASLASDDKSLRRVACDNCETLLTCGFLKPIETITCRNIDTVIAAVSFHCVITSIKAELDDIREGLSKAEILHAIEIFPDLFKTFFVKQDNPLTAGKDTL